MRFVVSFPQPLRIWCGNSTSTYSFHILSKSSFTVIYYWEYVVKYTKIQPNKEYEWGKTAKNALKTFPNLTYNVYDFPKTLWLMLGSLSSLRIPSLINCALAYLKKLIPIRLAYGQRIFAVKTPVQPRPTSLPFPWSRSCVKWTLTWASWIRTTLLTLVVGLFT
jgi:hypothetical protein